MNINIRKKILFFIPVLFIAVIVFFLFPGDEKKIRANLAALAEYSSTSLEKTVIATLQNAAAAAKLCKDPCTVHIESFDINRKFDRQELIEHILIMKRNLPNVSFGFHDTLVEFSDNDRAEIITTLQVKGEFNDERIADAYEFSMKTEKINGDWFFYSFAVVEFMKK